MEIYVELIAEIHRGIAIVNTQFSELKSALHRKSWLVTFITKILKLAQDLCNTKVNVVEKAFSAVNFLQDPKHYAIEIKIKHQLTSLFACFILSSLLHRNTH